jgi:hypothetical protein
MQMEKFDKFNSREAKRIGDIIGVNWKEYPLEEFRMGLHVELEHGARDPYTNVTDDDVVMTGKIALAHLKEFPDYYTRLNELEEEAEQYWEKKKRKTKAETKVRKPSRKPAGRKKAKVSKRTYKARRAQKIRKVKRS